MIRAPALVAGILWAAVRLGCRTGELRRESPSLAGTWSLEAADKLLPDGTRARFEEAYFTDDSLLDRIEAAEDLLVSDYVLTSLLY